MEISKTFKWARDSSLKGEVIEALEAEFQFS
jgi:hypothetical protein